MTHYNSFKKLVGNSEFSAHISVAERIDVLVDNGGEWGELVSFHAGEKIITPSGKMYTIIGFTIADTLICVQRGLDIDPAIRFVELVASDKIIHDDFQGYGQEHTSHKDGLVNFA